MLRRAALLLRDIGGLGVDPQTDEVLSDLAAEMGKAKPDHLAETIVVSGLWQMLRSRTSWTRKSFQERGTNLAHES